MKTISEKVLSREWMPCAFRWPCQSQSLIVLYICLSSFQVWLTVCLYSTPIGNKSKPLIGV